MSGVELPKFQTKECPFCHRSFSAVKKSFSFKEFFSPHNAHQVEQITKLSKTNPFAAGVLATFKGLNQFGVAQVYFCPHCHLPHIS